MVINKYGEVNSMKIGSENWSTREKTFAYHKSHDLTPGRALDGMVGAAWTMKRPRRDLQPPFSLSILNKTVANFFETLICMNQTTRRYIPEDPNMNIHCLVNLRSHIPYWN
jgi:hypothetical protein